MATKTMKEAAEIFAHHIKRLDPDLSPDALDELNDAVQAFAEADQDIGKAVRHAASPHKQA